MYVVDRSTPCCNVRRHANGIPPYTLAAKSSCNLRKELAETRVHLAWTHADSTFLAALSMGFASIYPAEYADKLLKAILCHGLAGSSMRSKLKRTSSAVRVRLGVKYWYDGI